MARGDADEQSQQPTLSSRCAPFARARNSGRDRLRAWLWTLPVVWTLLIALALWWNTVHIRETVQDMARGRRTLQL